MNTRRVMTLLALSLLAFAPARAQDEGGGMDESEKPVVVSEAEWKVYWKLRFEEAVAKTRAERTRDKKKLEAIEAARAASWKESGWTKERFEKVDQEVRDVLQIIEGSESKDDPEAAAGYKEQLEQKDKTTVATVRAHKKELSDYPAESKAIEDAVKERSLPRPVDPAKLAGTWVMDLDETIRLIGGGMFGEAEKKKVKEDMQKTLVSATYTFGPGDAIEARNELPGGKVDVEKGTYKVEGRKITFKRASGKERTLDAGMEDDLLIIGKLPMASVFKKKN